MSISRLKTLPQVYENHAGKLYVNWRSTSKIHAKFSEFLPSFEHGFDSRHPLKFNGKLPKMASSSTDEMAMELDDVAFDAKAAIGHYSRPPQTWAIVAGAHASSSLMFICLNCVQ